MRSHRLGMIAFAFVLFLGACYPGRANSGSGQNPDLIGNWELQELSDYTAFDAIRRLRPAWLSRGTPTIHLNGVPLSSFDQLEEISAVDIREMRFLNGPDASTRFGTGYMNGAILITLER